MDSYSERLEAALSKQIRIEIAERDIDQKTLAESMGIGRATLNRYIMGHRSMNAATFFKLTEALRIAPSVLLERAEARISSHSVEQS